MDINNFINSRDVAAHCREIGKVWNTCEMAAIIHRSNRTTEQKHSAWQELIDCYPDAGDNSVSIEAQYDYDMNLTDISFH